MSPGATPSSTTTPNCSAPSIPRPSASVIVINSCNEILLVQRNVQAKSFAGVHVFPGGNYDSRQDDSLEMTAIRETFEESGILLASPLSGTSTSKSEDGSSVLGDADLDAARDAIHSQKLLFKDFLKHNGLSPDVKALLPFTEWVTPVGIPRRFYTRFYVSFLGSSSSSSSSTASTVSSQTFTQGQTQHRLPTPDGAHEVLSAKFIHPSDIISRFHSPTTSTTDPISLFPPQYYLIATLTSIFSNSASPHSTTQEQIEKVRTLSGGYFGRMVINPRRIPIAEEELLQQHGEEMKGRAVLAYEGDERRGGSKGRMHRSLVLWGKNGAPEDIKLLRNWDVFTEFEPEAFKFADSESRPKL